MAKSHRHLSLGGLLGLLLSLPGCSLNFVATKIPQSARKDRQEHCEKQQTPPAATEHFKRVLIIVFENQTYRNVLKDPYFAELAGPGLLFSNFHGLFHPSYSNYLAMVSGREIPTSWDHQLNLDRTIRTIADSLAEAKHSPPLTWKNYAEAYPGNALFCFTGESHGIKYARKHVPFLSFKSIQSDLKACRNVVPASQFWNDFQTGALPDYAFYSPDLDDDGHDPPLKPRVGLRKASIFLRDFLRSLLADQTFMRDTLTVITFDESHTIVFPDSNHIYTLFLGNMVDKTLALKNDVPSKYYTHYDVLRTIEENFGLPALPNNAVPACAIEGIWRN